MHATRYIHYIYIIGIAFLLQGCNRESHPSTPELETISMVAAEVGTTRALMNNLTDLQNTGFRVYGYKVDNAANKQQVFTDDGQSVRYDGANGWSYDPIRYWDRVANYWFAAYAPTSLAVTNKIAAKQTLTFTKLPNWQEINGTETDLIVATSQGPATTYLDNEGIVNLTFNHAYAQFVVRVVRSASFKNTYKLKSLAYTNVPTADGTATYTLGYTTPANSAWSGVTMLAANESMNAFSSTSGEEITSNPEATPGAKHLVVPFNLGDKVINVTVGYTVNDGDLLTGTANTGIKQMEEGKRYVLTLSLGSGATITPSLDIENWVEMENGEEIEIDGDEKHNW